MKYGDRISLLREQKKLTQGEMAEITGISRAALSHYENNRRQPDYETLKIIADFFKVTIDYLMWGAEGKSEWGPETNIKTCINHMTSEKKKSRWEGYHITHFQLSVIPSRLL